ncbi:MAG: hypothetical protein FXF49_11090 [Flexistipes sinusarabici]|uniref:CRISPR-associated protein, Csh1 family n=1 Tax=Flexistipes sinusarabici TaxID=2352 RepID=A0A5D0MM52_FLESI|nr:TM1802 family CRISPR-associated protein [Flexistipes sinusarabici]TYB32520.1 MAG: hypothetical protein FXF49_11090 [Flexistipes sinusarabici]
MINSFANIGKSLLTNEKTSLEYEAKKRFLEQVSITPYIKNDKNALGKAICLNFDINKNCAEFILSDDDLSSENKSKFFAHSQKGNTKNIFLNTSSIITLITSTVSDSIKALTEDWKNWSKNNIDSDYINLLKQIMEKFYYYDQHSKKYILNPEKLNNENKEKFYKIKEEKQEKSTEVIYNYLLNNLYFDRDSKNASIFPNVAKLLINNQDILEYNENKFAQSYVNIIYYALLGSHFTKDKIENKICHVCNKKTTVLKSSYPLPMKFFGTTNFLFFNDLDNKKSYQSFAICEDCARDAFAGMKFVENNFNTYLFNITCFLIPNLAKEEHFESNLYKQVLKIIKNDKSKYKNELEILKNLIEKSNNKRLSFDLLFYYSENQMFNILKHIPNIQSNNLIKKFEMYDNFSENFNLTSILGTNKALTLNKIIYYLFTKSRGNKLEYDNKKILEFLYTFFSNKQFLYRVMIKNFVAATYSKILNDDDKFDKLSSLYINMFLKILIDLNMLKGVDIMSNKNSATEILNNDYNHFFDVHKEIYDNDPYRQGLFLLGTVISQILKMQREKSSNFFSKINFNGLTARKIPSFINKVKEYTVIYRMKENFYEEPGIWGNIMDRLQGIETSKMSNDEIIFYLLSGISYSEYIARKKRFEKEKKEIENNNFMEDNDE